MEDLHSMMSMSPTMTTSTSTSSLSGSKIPDDHDFDDVISSQHEINRLSKEVTHLQTECEKWRRLHGSQSTQSNFQIGGADEHTGIVDESSLHAQIKELENQLALEDDNHQHELSVLQDAHIQKQASIKRQHKMELQDLQDRLDLLQDDASSSGHSTPHSDSLSPTHSPVSPSSPMDVDRLRSELRESQHSLQKLRKDRQHLEESNKRLKVDLEQTKLVEKEKSRTLQVLNRQLEAIQTEKQVLFDDNEQFRKEKKQLREKLNKLQAENESIKGDKRKYEQLIESKGQEFQLANSKIQSLQEKVTEQEDELNELRRDNDQVSTSTMRQELRHARNKFSSTAIIRRTKLLREKQDIVNKMIDIGEQVSESKSSVASLQATNQLMKSETSEMIEELGDTEIQDLTSELVDTLEAENQILREHVVKLENEVSDLQQSCSSLVGDKEECEKVIVQLNRNFHDFQRDDTRSSQVGFDSETESVTRPSVETHAVKHIQYKRPKSPSESSTATEVSNMTGAENTDVSSDGERRLVEGSDSISFDGEYDDSIMFSSMKQRFPEAAQVIQQQIEQLEMFQADWTMEKQALEDVVVSMRAQLKEKDMQLKQNITAQKGLLQVEHEKQDQLQENVNHLQVQLSQLGARYDSILSEKEMLEKHKNIIQQETEELSQSFSDQSQQVHTLKEENKRMAAQIEHHQGNLRSLEKEVEKYKEDNENNSHRLLEINQEKTDLMKAIEELDQQHQNEISQVVESRDVLAKDVKNLTSEIETLKQNFEDDHEKTDTKEIQLEKSIEDLKKSLSEEKLQRQCLEEECEEKDGELTALRSELQEQKVSNIEADSSRVNMQDQTRDLQVKITELEEEISEMKKNEEEISTLKNEISRLQKDLSGKVETVSKQQKDIDLLNNKVEAFNAKSVEIAEENYRLGIAKSEDNVQHLSTSVDDLQKVVADLQMDLEVAQTECETLQNDLSNKSKEYEVTMDEMSKIKSMAASSIELERENLSQSVNHNENKIEELRNQLEEMAQDLQETNDMLTSTLDNNKKLSEVLKEKENDIKKLAQENSFLQNAVEQQKVKLTDAVSLKEQKQQLEEMVEKHEEEMMMLNTELHEVQRKLQATPEREIRETQTLGIITELESELEKLRLQLKHKDSELMQFKNEVEDQNSKHQESLNDSRQMADDLKELLREKEREIIEMNEALQSRDHSLDSLQDDESFNKSVVLEKEAEICSLQEQLRNLTQEIDIFKENILKKEVERSDLLKKLDESNQDLFNKDQLLNQTKDEFENQIVEMDTILTQSTEKLENVSKELLIKDASLSDVKFHMDKLVKEKDDEILKLIEETELLKREVQDKQKDILELQTTAHLQVISNGTKDQSGLSDNEKQFEKIIKEREREISNLKEKVIVLTGLLEEKSTSVMGNNVLVDLHKAQMQVKTFEAERNQMMTVLNEKTRECSNLKNEVHRLLRAVASDKNALDKALEDNQNMVEKMKGPNNDMRKEALQNLSRLVQDKDLEIEALKQKNESLLLVLQRETPDKTTDVSNLLVENSNLQKSNTVLIEERDQLVVSIHQKHQESLAYYEEVQRLAGIVTTETQNHNLMKVQVEQLTKDSQQKDLELSTIKTELDEKNNSVLQLQEDLENYKGSLSKLDKDFNALNDSFLEMENVKKELETKLSASVIASENEDKMSVVIKEKEGEIIELKKLVDEFNKSLAQGNASVIEENVLPPTSVILTASVPGDLTDGRHHAGSVKTEKANAGEDTESLLFEIQNLKQKLKQTAKTDEIINNLKDRLSEEKIQIREIDNQLKEKIHELQKKNSDIAMLKEQIDIQNQALMDGEVATQHKSQEALQLRNQLQSREIELQTFRKQKETLQFELEGFRLEVEGHKKENLNLQHAIHNKDAECRQIQDLCNRMSAEIQEKNFEITALKEKSATLKKLVEEDSSSQGQMQDLLRETEAMQMQAALFQQERDQVMLALQNTQAELASVKQQFQSSDDKNQRLERELSRLRSHLLEMEESYTKDALQAEEREKELRNRIVAAEEKAISSSTDVQKASFEATAHIESLLDQLHAVTAQKDEAHIQLAAAHEQIQQYSDSMTNLQMVLEQFQQEKDVAMQTEIEQHARRAKEKEKAAQLLLKQNDELKNKLEETKEALSGAMRLNEQLDKKEDLIKKLKEEVHAKEDEAEQYHQKLIEFNTMNGSKVDKPLIRNLFVGYFTTPDAKKSQVLKLIGSVLEFSESELQKVGAEGHQRGWLSGFWSKPSASKSPPMSPTTAAANKSFMEQFVTFLETESTPVKKPRLPVEDMIRDEPRTPAFNPFSAPIPKESPFIKYTPPKSSGDKPPGFLQPTIAPVPMFSAIAVTPKSSLEKRSAPPQKGNILKEVLNN
ncbi:thyroid receptor-interacting protein 11-like isoform X2 [Anneissia japonica]|uniref:thyroid receptor-interacting protein 11-like isoform X2 n=1 Tax=Anneissia japonica TaxID=1529436 RepID=UPI00142574BF|nr:thyroid receptor-interacting protein 11-like isoform X2 [Anneissia japonica]